MSMIRVTIIEDEDIFRIGTATVLSETQKIQICGEAKYGKEGLNLINDEQPDIVIVDINLPDISGIEVIGSIKCRYENRIKVVVVTRNNNKETVSAALNKGADCYYCKTSKKDKLIEAVFTAYNGESWIDPVITRMLIDKATSKEILTEKNQCEFSVREISVLKLAAAGMKNEQIANKLCLSEGTIRSHMHNIFTKLGVKDRLNAVREAIRHKVINYEDLKADCTTENVLNNQINVVAA